MYKMRKCEKRFDVRFYSLRTTSLTSACRVILFACQHRHRRRGHIPPKISEKIF